MLTIEKANQFYGGSQILWDLDFAVEKGSRTCVMGRNGVGKTTLVKCIMGQLPLKEGQMRFNGELISGHSTEARARAGIGYVPQGRDIFGQLTVEENLRVALAAGRQKHGKIPDMVYELFPVLADMRHRRGGDLSGGQQQQLAIGRALVLEPELLILDEPNEGIQPNIVAQIRDVIIQLNEEQGITVILVEQKLHFARAVGQAFCLMEKGRVVANGAMQTLTDQLIAEYLAV
ncbi:High-affinity branched-chain amino acid transport ATP-binding protein LivF [BD1-7 clade bacterium]|uniref:High-affinity branched-chain amino acid transport ATP-binding protein LivF n=1 Tax=BD1-7 clade bacterium TaxID=2029982 RepID=A0A5S9QU17_9GAMM|nr:High-affinity branched-chain amino acid transport ATP-binding protein LivF [BD1-7 clade bacterium]CAA0122860.1 High-affinity branched-chain amino acid transport ATP-binding protein LivF [BD1-7 clade bacterium]